MVRDYYATVVAERKEMVVIQSAGHTPLSGSSAAVLHGG